MPRSNNASTLPASASARRLRIRNSAPFWLIAPMSSPCPFVGVNSAGDPKEMVNAAQPRSNREVIDQPRRADPGGGNEAHFTFRTIERLERRGIDQGKVIHSRESAVPEQFSCVFERCGHGCPADDCVTSNVECVWHCDRALPL